MAITQRTIGRLKLGSTVYAITDGNIETEVQAEHAVHSGFAVAQQVMVAGAGVPRITARGPLSRILTGIGFVPAAATTPELYLATVTGAVADSGSTHIKYGLNTSATACVYLDSFEVSEGGEAIASVAVRCYSSDGDADPLKVTGTVAMPPLTAAALHHGVGPLTVNGTTFDGVVGVRYSSGASFTAQRADAKPYAIGEIQGGLKQTITVDLIAPKEAWETLSSKGLGISSNAVVNLHAYSATAMSLTDTGKITLTIAKGYVSCETFGGSHGSLIRGSVTIYAASADGAATGIAVS